MVRCIYEALTFAVAFATLMVSHHGEPTVDNGMAEVLTNGDLSPSVPVDQIPGVENGMTDPSATDDLIELGCRDDAVYTPDPNRDPAMRQEFLHQHGYEECPEGYEVHHVVPLYAGGADTPENMFWYQ